MDINQILGGLYSERDRITQAIEALEALSGARTSVQSARKKGKVAAAAAKPTRKRKGGLTPAGRKRLSQNMKKRWAERKKKLAKAT